MALLHVVRLTAAAQIDLPRTGLTLAGVRCVGGATPGTFSFNYDGVASAHFPSPSNATRGFASYAVNHKVEGNTIPATAMAFNGGIAAVELIFTAGSAPAGAPAMKSYRAIRFARTDAAATTADIQGTFAGAAAKPKFIVGYSSAQQGRAVFPQVGSLTFRHEAIIAENRVDVVECPEMPEAQNLTLSVATDAGPTTIQFVVYY